MVKRTLADVYAFFSVLFGTATLAVGVYGTFAFFHVFGLSFHFENLLVSVVVFVFLWLLSHMLFLREYEREQKGVEGVSK